MKKYALILALAGAVTIGGTALTYASDAPVPTNTECTNTSIAKNHKGINKLMKEGLSFEDAKQEILKYKFERVDAAVERGVITAERGEEIKAEMKANSDKCTTPEEFKNLHGGYGLNKGLKGKGKGDGSGNGSGKMRSQGKGQGACTQVTDNQ
ncbi:hypothetical protein SAMN02745196_02052 [Clostridium collagenovorans DSM 3089]|uniref:DUF2680 domain-containing protein n=1 Tax=Clostridium collagenovorans DSM 3089 TaxID=1121306 RepID=A0A1M5X6J6_9CLOT|nr:hypothetical protein [Clostridium collagenovorans]SHH95457.1 hypothetical protein SAMN02745196_02052 [Clostridium collagenovorans DSM 3089]